MRITAVAALVVFSLVVNWGTALGTVHNVDCGGGAQHLTIQAAVNAAANGDTVRLAPCIYNEQVMVLGKTLTIQGSGAGVTEIRWGGSPPAVLFEAMPSPRTSYVRDVSVVQGGVHRLRVAVQWSYGHVVFERCHADSILWGDMRPGVYAYTSVEVYDSSIEGLRVFGDGESIVEGSTVGKALFLSRFEGGANWQPMVHSRGNSYGGLCVRGAVCHSSDDVAETLGVMGGVGVWPEFYAAGSSFGRVVIVEDSMVDLDRCDVSDLSYEYSPSSRYAPLIMSECLVRGDVMLRTNTC
jgi:hypothetical protein